MDKLLRLGSKHHHPQRRYVDGQAVFSSVTRDFIGDNSSEIPLSAAAVDRCIAIQDLGPSACLGDSHPIVMSRNWCEIANDENHLPRTTLPKETHTTVFRVVGIDPLKSLRLTIEFVQGGFSAIGSIQIFDPTLNPLMA